ncbi:cation-translocating P-type ATPase [Roseateles saccharophilus]|uniref:Ca2+-transporting ATPase n=1 Tax=Roseateles saccharophilus TaxID=304 RepID=A0A4R3UHP0_ROSSA|nr:cation-translocating P-type ATPase [Roseateles saccharophilus]MDG0834820.1 cation-translocating P-type ATPase [Roseateles saccharophilus]TCU88943.1 Ca2+-transporting ATPase [Roseateles saccharophilus]
MADSSLPGGLTADEARRRLAEFGPNELQGRESGGLVALLRSIATEPMFLLLLAAAGLYLVVGDLGEGLMLAGFAVVTVGLTLMQERRSARALDALRELTVPQVRVIRDGSVQRLPVRELVPGDLFLFTEGERIAADGLVRDAVGLGVDESLLTGESVPVRKSPSPGTQRPAAAPPGGDDTPWVFASTLVVAGHGLAEVVATGERTEVGRIGVSLAGIATEATPLQRQLGRLVRLFGGVAIAACALLAAWWGLSRGDWLQGLLSAIALGMAMLPEEFPMVLAVFLALGAWRLARLKVLARRPAVVEALGAATVLCVDKTGTLTENRMQLRRLVSDTDDVEVRPGAELPEAVHRLAEFALLASQRDGLDPMDRAVLALGDAALQGSEHLHPEWQLAREYPLTPALLAMAQAWTAEDGRRWLAAKGAPEAIFDLCHLEPAHREALLARVRGLATEGLRVLAVAEGRHDGRAEHDGATLPEHPHAHGFALLGLLGFADPLRAGVPEAVAQAREAGIAVAMITGDHAATALAIAAQAGLDTNAGALAGAELAGLDDTALAAAVRRVRVFARVSPEQKLRLVQAFKRNGETVAMTGDGVNDAPALKAAHVGIAMGARGTDVAREAAGLVLLDEDFGHIVAGVRMGRRIFDNLRKAMVYITAIHVPVVGLALLPMLFGLPPLLLPAHVVLTEMVIDPACSLAFEGAPEDPRVMRRPPRNADRGLIDRGLLLEGLLQGAVLLGATLAIYALALQAGRGADVARTLAVVGLTVGNLLLVAATVSAGLGLRTLLQPGARPLWIVAAAATAALGSALLWAPLRGLLHFGVPSASDLGAALLAIVLAVTAGAALAPRCRGAEH